MAGLFSSNEQDMLGTIMQQRNQSNQALGSGYGKYGGIVQAGAGMADIGGDAMFGGATGASDPRMIEQQEVKAIFSKAATQTGNSTSPEFYMALSKLLAAKFPEQSKKAAEQAQKVKNETEDRAMAKEKHDADLITNKLNGSGTGDERMLAKISGVRRRLMQKEFVEPWEIAEAQDMLELLGKQKTYKDSNGNLVTLSQARLAPLPVPQNQQQNSTQESQTQTSVDNLGVRITGTPEGKRGTQKKFDAAETQLAGLNQTLNNGQKIIDLYAEQGTGAFSSLNPLIVGVAENVGGTEARTAAVARKSLEADKVIDTLLRMKAESPTGSTGFGALNIEELNQIKGQFQKLDPMSNSYIEDVQTYLKEVTRIRDKVANIVAEMRGTPVNNKPIKSKYNNEDIINRAMAANPSASREAIVKALVAKGWLNN